MIDTPCVQKLPNFSLFPRLDVSTFIPLGGGHNAKEVTSSGWVSGNLSPPGAEHSVEGATGLRGLRDS